MRSTACRTRKRSLRPTLSKLTSLPSMAILPKPTLPQLSLPMPPLPKSTSLPPMSTLSKPMLSKPKLPIPPLPESAPMPPMAMLSRPTLPKRMLHEPPMPLPILSALLPPVLGTLSPLLGTLSPSLLAAVALVVAAPVAQKWKSGSLCAYPMTQAPPPTPSGSGHSSLE